jgi:hypothetical protein
MSTALSSGSRTRHLWAAGLLLAAGLVYVMTARAYFTYDHDMATYLGLAASLARGNGYVFDGLPHTTYPPGLPLLLAPLFMTGLRTAHSAQVLVAGTAVAALLATYAYLVQRGATRPLLICLAIAIAPAFYRIATSLVYAEAPYLLCTTAVLAWAEREATHPEGSVRRVWLAAGAALAMVAAVATRTAGVSLVVALLIAFVHIAVVRRGSIRRLAATAGVAAVGMAAVAAWMWYVARYATSLYPGQGRMSYFSLLRLVDPHRPDLGSASLLQVLERLPTGVMRQVAHTAELLTGIPWLLPLWTSPFVVAALLFVGWGILLELRRPQPLAGWYVICYSALFAVWPYDERQRFLIPIAPLLFVLALQGARGAGAWALRQPISHLGAISATAGALFLAVTVAILPDTPSRQAAAGALVWAALMFVGAATWVVRRSRPRRTLAPFPVRWLVACWGIAYGALCAAALPADITSNRPAAAADQRKAASAFAAAWIESRAAPSDLIMAQDYAELHYVTGRRVVPLPETGNPVTLASALLALRPRYVVINDPLRDPYVLPTEPERLTVMLRSGAGQLLPWGAYSGGRVYLFEPATAP